MGENFSQQKFPNLLYVILEFYIHVYVYSFVFVHMYRKSGNFSVKVFVCNVFVALNYAVCITNENFLMGCVCCKIIFVAVLGKNKNLFNIEISQFMVYGISYAQ